jgi:hypothetical protein
LQEFDRRVEESQRNIERSERLSNWIMQALQGKLLMSSNTIDCIQTIVSHRIDFTDCRSQHKFHVSIRHVDHILQDTIINLLYPLPRSIDRGREDREDL